MSWSSISPSLVAAVVATAVASGAAGYTAGTRVTSSQIVDNTIQGRDVKNSGLTGDDIRNGSLARSELDRGCSRGSVAAFGGCVTLKALKRRSYAGAVATCNDRNGRLPTLHELTWLLDQPGFEFGDQAVDPVYRWEFTGSSTLEEPVTPVGLNATGRTIPNARAQLFAHHCVVY